MIKKFTTAFALAASTLLFSQVGIGTPTPQATLDVTGTPTNTAKLDGIIAPRLTGAELRGKTYTTAQTGALVYVTAADTAPAGQTVDVTTSGYYYFNGTKWVVTTTTDTNIYKGDGALTGVRVLTQNGNNLTFRGTNQETTWQAGALRQFGTAGSKRADIGLIANDNNANSRSSALFLFVDPESFAQISASSDAIGLSLSTTSTSASAPILFSTCPGSGTSVQRAEIAGDGRMNIVNTLSVGYSAQQTFTGAQKLKVNGSIVTASATYPDYVFENYFSGNSLLKPDYQFTSLYDTEKFIKENHHLPGVSPVTELEKTDDGKYAFNITELSVQSLEKVEELYLHTIEQQKQIDKQNTQINTLVKLVENMQKEIETLKNNKN